MRTYLKTESIKLQLEKPFILLFLCLVFMVRPVFGQDLGLLAKYPLDTEGDKIMRLYDVSGNGNHGKLVNLSNNKLENIYKGASFPAGGQMLNKLTTDNSYISIPDIYKGKNLSQNGFAVTFWLYVEDVDIPMTTNLISLPQFSVIKTREDPKSYSHLVLQYLGEGQNAYIPIPDQLEGNTWYFVYLGYGGQNKGDVVEYGLYRYDGASYISTADAINFHTLQDKYPLSSKLIAQSPAILDSRFQGALGGVTFYDRLLQGRETINYDRNSTWFIADGTPENIIPEYNYPVSNPQSYYGCAKNPDPNTVNITDPIGKRNATSGFGANYITDRFGNGHAALGLSESGYIKLPNFFEDCQGCKTQAIDPVKGYSISFWTYIDQPLFPPDDTVFPYTDQDDTFQFLFVNGKEGNRGGIALRRDRLIVDRYVEGNPIRPWQMWLWDPVSFQNVKGWNHVIFCQKENATQVYIYKANGELGATLNYFNSQPFSASDGLTFGFGKPENSSGTSVTKACKTIDDVRVFSWPLSEKEVNILHKHDSQNTTKIR